MTQKENEKSENLKKLSIIQSTERNPQTKTMYCFSNIINFTNEIEQKIIGQL
jgi:hypothetical protein